MGRKLRAFWDGFSRTFLSFAPPPPPRRSDADLLEQAMRNVAAATERAMAREAHGLPNGQKAPPKPVPPRIRPRHTDAMTCGVRVLRLVRDHAVKDEPTGHVADIVVFPDGLAVLHWRTSRYGQPAKPAGDPASKKRHTSGMSEHTIEWTGATGGTYTATLNDRGEYDLSVNGEPQASNWTREQVEAVRKISTQQAPGVSR